MSVLILKDELYPVFFISESEGREIDIPDILLHDYLEAFLRFSMLKNNVEYYYNKVDRV